MKKNWYLLPALLLLCAAPSLPVSAAGVETLFDADYYRTANPDLEALYGNDAEALYAHFLRCGVYEGRDCTPLFDVDAYKAANPDLAASCGDDNLNYYEQYVNEGMAQGRESGGLFDVGAYAAAYPDLRAAFGNDIQALYQHFLTTGIYEGRLEGLRFNYWCYGALNPDLGASYAEQPQLLYLQYIQEGMAEGRIGTRTDPAYRYLYCEKDGYGGEEHHLIRQWTVGQWPEDGKKGYDEAYCEVCGKHFRDEMDWHDYYTNHLHLREPDLIYM